MCLSHDCTTLEIQCLQRPADTLNHTSCLSYTCWTGTHPFCALLSLDESIRTREHKHEKKKQSSIIWLVAFPQLQLFFKLDITHSTCESKLPLGWYLGTDRKKKKSLVFIVNMQSDAKKRWLSKKPRAGALLVFPRPLKIGVSTAGATGKYWGQEFFRGRSSHLVASSLLGRTPRHDHEFQSLQKHCATVDRGVIQVSCKNHI